MSTSQFKGEAYIICRPCFERVPVRILRYKRAYYKHDQSMLRFILVNAAHSVVKFSERMKRKYLSLVSKAISGAIVAMILTFIEITYTMLSMVTELIDSTDALKERKMVTMRSRAVKPSKTYVIEYLMNDLMNAGRRGKRESAMKER